MDEIKIGQLLTLCLGKKDDTDKAGRLRTLSESEWKALVQESMAHRVAPLLYHKLKPLMSMAGISDSLVTRLKEACLFSAARNMRLYAD
jgi:hypothetical protein